MPFFFRKSIKLGAGARLNFSKSGVGASFGSKGYRVSTGPRGTYVTIGAGGIYYRQKIDVQNGQTANARVPHPHASSTSNPTGTPIYSADADYLTDVTSGATLAQINAASKQPTYQWLIAVSGAIFSLLMAQVHIIFFLIAAALTFYTTLIAKASDEARRTYSIHYRLEDVAGARWNNLNQSLFALGQSQSVWRVTTMDQTYDWKRNAGASNLLSRARVCIGKKSPRYLSCNVTPYCLDIGNQSLFFLPDRIYVYQNSTFGAVEYASLAIDFGQTNFIENDIVPKDAQIVGQTWQFVNKNGGPDLRFNNNRQLPIAQYNVIELKSSVGLHILLHVSSTSAAEQFVKLFPFGHRNTNSSSRSHSQQNQRTNHSQRTEQTKNQQQAPPPKPTPPLPACYKILGLIPTCTK